MLMHIVTRQMHFVSRSFVSFKEPLHFFYVHTFTQTFTLNSGIFDIWLTTFTQTFTLNSGIRVVPAPARRAALKPDERDFTPDY